MANKSGSLLIKVAVVIAVIGAVFFALDTWRKKTGEKATAPSGDEMTAESPAGALSREEAERIGREIGTRIGTEIGTQIGREVAAQMLAERAAEIEARKAVATPAPIEPEPTPSAEDTVAAVESDAAAPLESSPAPAESATAPQETSQPRPAPNRAWWTKSQSSDPDALVLEHVGDFRAPDGTNSGITLQFNGRFDANTDYGALSPPRGWERGAKQGLIYLPRIPPGRYTMTIKAGFRDADGKTVKQDISGPITVR